MLANISASFYLRNRNRYIICIIQEWHFFCIFVVLLWGRFGFDRVALSMLACSALYGEHLKENVQNNNWRK